MRHPLLAACNMKPRNQMILGVSATTGLDPVITAGGTTSLTWTAPSGAVSTGETPSPALDEAGDYVIAMDAITDMTALDETAFGTPPAYRYRTVATHLGYLLRTNIRLVTEFGYDLEKEESRFLIGFVSAY